MSTGSTLASRWGIGSFFASDSGTISSEAAQRRNARIALAWALHRPGVTAPIVGLSKPHHLDDALAALDLTLDDAENALLEVAFNRTVEPVQW